MCCLFYLDLLVHFLVFDESALELAAVLVADELRALELERLELELGAQLANLGLVRHLRHAQLAARLLQAHVHLALAGLEALAFAHARLARVTQRAQLALVELLGVGAQLVDLAVGARLELAELFAHLLLVLALIRVACAQQAGVQFVLGPLGLVVLLLRLVELVLDESQATLRLHVLSVQVVLVLAQERDLLLELAEVFAQLVALRLANVESGAGLGEACLALGQLALEVVALVLGAVVVVALEVGLLQQRLGVGQLVVQLLAVHRVHVEGATLVVEHLLERVQLVAFAAQLFVHALRVSDRLVQLDLERTYDLMQLELDIQ